MANKYFRFKQFCVYQDLCAMKVGTDGTLLGAWANGGKRILDIGTGTGLIAMMMSQRYPDANIHAIDIDEKACEQARMNITESPFHNKIVVENIAVQSYCDIRFDSIVCNPPYFANSLNCPDKQRDIARHTTTLDFKELFASVDRLLINGGIFSLIIPTECFSMLDAEAKLHGMICRRKYSVRTVPGKQPRRYLLEYSNSAADEFDYSDVCLEDGTHKRSEWYEVLTREFYLK